MRTIIVLLTSLIFLSSCDYSLKEPAKQFTPKTPELLISKIYYNKDFDSTYLIGEYTYDSMNRLIQRVTYNPTSLLVSITQTFEYENGKAVRSDFTELTAYNNNIDNPDTTRYYNLFSYNDNGFLSTVQTRSGVLIHFEYDNDGKVIKSYIGEIDIDACDDYDENDFMSINPTLWTEYDYEDGNVVTTTYKNCGDDSEINLIFDDKKKPSDGLDYIPRVGLLPLISQYGYLSPSLSTGNVTDYGTLSTYEYEYNDKGYPKRIIPFYNGHEKPDFEIEYKEPI